MAQVEDDRDKTYQEQWMVFGSSKVAPKRHVNRNGERRYWKSVGLGFATPRAAVEGSYVDKKCPWTSNTAVRGRIMRGIVRSNKMKRTVALRRDYMKFVPKYSRFEKRHSSFSAHLSPALEVEIGDEVICGQTRPTSKSVRFTVLKVNPKTKPKTSKKTKAMAKVVASGAKAKAMAAPKLKAFSKS